MGSFTDIVEYKGADYPTFGGSSADYSAASGWFNANQNGWAGLNSGQTINTTDPGHWEVFVDLNGDGNYSTYDSSTGLFLSDQGERISNIHFENSQGFQTGVGTISAGDISGWYTVQNLLPVS